MNIVLRILCALGAIACLYIFTFACSFYHAFEGNRECFDNYALTASIIFGISSVVLFRMAVI